MSSLSLGDAVERAGRIPDWSMEADVWRDIIIKSGGTIDSASDARERMALLVCYLVAADCLSNREKANVWKRFAAARSDENEDLPTPVEGPAFTAAEAKTVLATPALKAA